MFVASKKRVKSAEFKKLNYTLVPPLLHSSFIRSDLKMSDTCYSFLNNRRLRINPETRIYARDRTLMSKLCP